MLQALLDVLKKNSSVLRTPSETGDKNSFGDMRTQLEVLRQQVRMAKRKPSRISCYVVLPSLPSAVSS